MADGQPEYLALGWDPKLSPEVFTAATDKGRTRRFSMWANMTVWLCLFDPLAMEGAGRLDACPPKTGLASTDVITDVPLKMQGDLPWHLLPELWRALLNWGVGAIVLFGYGGKGRRGRNEWPTLARGGEISNSGRMIGSDSESCATIVVKPHHLPADLTF